MNRAKRQKTNAPNHQKLMGLSGDAYRLQGPEDNTLLFESRFESGNLYLATKVSDQEYDCLMQNDINT